MYNTRTMNILPKTTKEMKLYCSILLHCGDLASGILHPSACSFGWCFLFFSSLLMYVFTTRFGLIDQLGFKM
jgi:hypothetical protein